MLIDDNMPMDERAAFTLPSPTVGIRELKARLSAYVRLVRLGGTVTVTDRGRPVAEMRPISVSDDAMRQALGDLGGRGLLGGALHENRPLADFEPVECAEVEGAGTVSDALVEDREDRF